MGPLDTIRTSLRATIKTLPDVARGLVKMGMMAGASGSTPTDERIFHQIQPLIEELKTALNVCALRVRPLIEETAVGLMYEQKERIKANYADEYMTYEPSASEERALLLRQAEISQEHHTGEILRLQELNTGKQAEIKLLRSQLEEKDTGKQAEIESLRSQLEYQTRLAIAHDGQYQMAEAENETLKSEIYRLREIIESMKASGNLQRKAVKVAVLQFPLMSQAFSDLADSVESPEGKDIISNFARMADEAHDTIIEAMNLNKVQH